MSHQYSEEELNRITSRLKSDFDSQILVPGSYRVFNCNLYPYVPEEGDTPDGPEAKFMFAIPTAEMLDALNKDEEQCDSQKSIIENTETSQKTIPKYKIPIKDVVFSIFIGILTIGWFASAIFQKFTIWCIFSVIYLIVLLNPFDY